jgi:hypothetical protein
VLPALGLIHASCSHQLAVNTRGRIAAAFALLTHKETVMGRPVHGKPQFVLQVSTAEFAELA